jgi:DNA-binding winged helix-turn-helix (wHTH) protein
MKDLKNRLFRFDDIEIDVQNLRVTVHSEIRPLEPRAFRLLLFLVENPDRAIPKDEIMTAVWSDTFVSENSLAKAITQIRKALDDDPRAPLYIQTVPSVGYRFVGEVSALDPDVAADPVAPGANDRVPASASPPRRTWLWVAAASAVVLLLNASLWLLKSRRAQVAPLKLVPVTTYAGSEQYPAFSPDGRQVAFYWTGEKGENPGIYIKLIGQPNALRLTNGPDAFPVWSPDGGRIAFVRGLEPGGAPVGNAIYTLSSLGGPERKIRDIQVFGQIDWSPDGKWLALAQGGAFNSSMFLLSPEGGEPRRIPNARFRQFDNAPSFSPDGRRLAFAGCAGRYDCNIYVQQLGRDGIPDSAPREIAHPGAGIYGITWSRDGRTLIYAAPAELRYAVLAVAHTKRWPREPAADRNCRPKGVCPVGFPRGASHRVRKFTRRLRYLAVQRARRGRIKSGTPHRIVAVGHRASILAQWDQNRVFFRSRRRRQRDLGSTGRRIRASAVDQGAGSQSGNAPLVPRWQVDCI